MKLDHIAIAVPDIDSALKQYQKGLALKASAIQALPEHGVRIVFLRLENATIELIEPLGVNSPIAKFLERQPGGGIHHFCIGDTAFDATLQRLEDQGIRRLTEPKAGAHGNLVFFLHPGDFHGTLVEMKKTGTDIDS